MKMPTQRDGSNGKKLRRRRSFGKTETDGET
jgi:hypothetical protein